MSEYSRREYTKNQAHILSLLSKSTLFPKRFTFPNTSVAFKTHKTSTGFHTVYSIKGDSMSSPEKSDEESAVVIEQTHEPVLEPEPKQEMTINTPIGPKIREMISSQCFSDLLCFFRNMDEEDLAAFKDRERSILPVHRLLEERAPLDIITQMLELDLFRVDLHDKNGFNCLHLSIFYSLSCLKLFIPKYIELINTSTYNDEEDTLLHIAVRERHISIIRILHRHKINLFANNKTGQTAHELAVKLNYLKCAEFLSRAEASSKGVGVKRTVSVKPTKKQKTH
ncbi:hypothetical protein PCE1_003997 [Barthelona sp. PCE]